MSGGEKSCIMYAVCQPKAQPLPKSCGRFSRIHHIISVFYPLVNEGRRFPLKKPVLSGLLAVTLLFLGFTLGFYLGSNRDQAAITVAVPKNVQTIPEEISTTKPPLQTEPSIVFPVNINTADKDTLMALPGIGETFALRILSYRQTYGPFSSVMDLMNVDGIGEKRMEEILDLITVGG